MILAKNDLYNSCNREEDLHPDGMMVSNGKLLWTFLWGTLGTDGIRSSVGNFPRFQGSFFWHPPNRLGWNQLVQGSRVRHIVWSTVKQLQKCGEVTCQLVMHRIWDDCSCACQLVTQIELLDQPWLFCNMWDALMVTTAPILTSETPGDVRTSET